MKHNTHQTSYFTGLAVGVIVGHWILETKDMRWFVPTCTLAWLFWAFVTPNIKRKP